jgi:hypothetical protein
LHFDSGYYKFRQNEKSAIGGCLVIDSHFRALQVGNIALDQTMSEMMLEKSEERVATSESGEKNSLSLSLS